MKKNFVEKNLCGGCLAGILASAMLIIQQITKRKEKQGDNQ